MKKLIFSIFVLMFTLSLISAADFTNPMAFYGNVNYPGGVPDGYSITVKIDDNVVNQCPIINSQYGYKGNECIIILEGDASGVLVNFYIQNTWIGSYIFEEMGIVKLDFTVNYLPALPTTPTDTSSGGSSGGGGGGVSGGGISTTTTTSTSPTDSEETDNGGTGELLNGGSKTDSKTGTNWLTGAVIGAFGETGSILFLIFIILVIAGVILFFVMRAKEEKNINAKIKEMIKKRR